MTETIPARHLLVMSVAETLSKINKRKEAGEVFTLAQAGTLIIDDLLNSIGMNAIIDRTTENAAEAGYDKGLRHAIAAVGTIDRNPEEYRHVDYEAAQAAIAALSTRVIEQWAKQKTEQ